MAKKYYTILHFVQNLNIELLEAYFKQAGIPFPDNLKVTDKDQKPNAQDIEAYINSLDSELQYKINDDFIEINGLSYEGGTLSLIEIANIYGIKIQDELNNLEGYSNQAIYCFLNHKEIFKKASEIVYFDNLSSKKITNGLVKKTIQEVTNNQVKQALETELKTYFKQKDGRGDNCQADITSYKDRIFYRAQPQNYSQFLFDYDNKGKFSKKCS